MATKTYTAKAKGKAYTMTVTDVTCPNGKLGLKLTCSCSTHDGFTHAMIHATPTSAADFPKSRIHGFVTMISDPIAGRMAERRGKGWKA